MGVYQSLHQQRTKAGSHRRVTRWESLRDWFRVVLFENGQS